MGWFLLFVVVALYLVSFVNMFGYVFITNTDSSTSFFETSKSLLIHRCTFFLNQDYIDGPANCFGLRIFPRAPS